MSVLATPQPLDAANSELDSVFDVAGSSRPMPPNPGANPQFHESATAMARRYALGLAYAARPVRLDSLPPVLRLTFERVISPGAAERRFRDLNYIGAQGLVGISEDLSPTALLDGYRRGIFPFCHIGPTKWWSPALRAVLIPEEIRIEKSLRKTIRQKKFRVTFDTDFAAVMRACAEPRPGKTPLTWITPRIMKAFWRLHVAGHAHSVEVWDDESNLVGGIYGLACGEVFFGESQFSLVRDASKIAGATLTCHLAHWGFVLRDAKWKTDHLASLGFRLMSRDAFLKVLREHAWTPGKVGRWKIDETLDVSAWQPSAQHSQGAHGGV